MLTRLLRGWPRLLPVPFLLAGMELAPRPADASWNALFDSGHTLLFGAVALVLLVWVRSAGLGGWKAYAAAFILAAAAGAASEAIQFPGPRDADPGDLGRDVLGAMGFLGLAAALDPKHRGAPRPARAAAGLLGACLVLVGLAPALLLGARHVRREALYPAIAAFDSPLDVRFLGKRDVALERVAWPGKEKGRKEALRVRFLPARYPGIVIDDPPRDWRGFRELAFDVFSESNTTLTLLVRLEDAVHDGSYDDRFNGTFPLEPGANAIRIPLEDVAKGPRERILDLSRMKAMTLFLDRPSRPAAIVVGTIRLAN